MRCREHVTLDERVQEKLNTYQSKKFSNFSGRMNI